jgi:hypothetical protein
MKPLRVKAREAKLSAKLLPSLKMWDKIKFMLLERCKQLSHLFLKNHGTMEGDLKAKVTNTESVSTHKFHQPFSKAISIAYITPINSAWKAE